MHGRGRPCIHVFRSGAAFLRYDGRLMFSCRTDWKLAPNRFTNALDEACAPGSELIDLTISNPTRAGLTYDSAAILDALKNPNSLE